MVFYLMTCTFFVCKNSEESWYHGFGTVNLHINKRDIGKRILRYKRALSPCHRRRIEREAKAKVVVSVWGAEFVKFLAVLAVLHDSIWKKRLNSSYSSKLTEAKQLAQQGIEQNLPPNRRDDLCLGFSLHPSSIYVIVH